jgi:hypothetical protein
MTSRRREDHERSNNHRKVTTTMNKTQSRQDGRTSILLDTENLHGGTDATPADVAKLVEAVLNMTRVPRATPFTLGASCQSMLLANGYAAPGARLVWLPGRDGADKALLNVLDGEDLWRRFATIVIGSGDGIFAPAARRLRLHGVHVTVVSRRESLSRDLARAASSILYLVAELATDTEAAA